MDPLDAKIRCLELSKEILTDDNAPASLKDVVDGAKVLWGWACDGLFSLRDEDDEEVTRQ